MYILAMCLCDVDLGDVLFQFEQLALTWLELMRCTSWRCTVSVRAAGPDLAGADAVYILVLYCFSSSSWP